MLTDSMKTDLWTKNSVQAFIQAVLLLSVFEQRLSFQMLLGAGWGLYASTKFIIVIIIIALL